MSTLSPEFGVRALFFSYFAFIGGISPYLSLYLSQQGHSIERIGVLMALPQLMRIIAPPFWGWLADATHRYRMMLRVSAMATLILALAMPWAGSSYAAIFIVLSLLFFASAAQAPIAEATALSFSAGDTGVYGRIRLWGSIGFLLAVVLIGPILDRTGIARLPHALIVLLFLLVLVVWLVPETQAPAPVLRTRQTRVRERLKQPAVMLFFIAAFLMIFAHASLYAFFSLFLEQHGYSKTAIGVIWAIGVVIEIALFRVQKTLFVRFGAGTLLSLSLFTAALRFGLIAASAGNLIVIVFIQFLHAITFGVHHSACMAYLHDWFTAQQQGRAQAIFTTISYGLGGSLGGLVAGLLWSRWQPEAAFWGAALASLVAWAVFALSRRLAYAVGGKESQGT